ncbi:FMN-binding protein [Hujiaoplasma nucleasis]|uniref:FMN-binding protein n=1 Tax=Hujiaoplasma nucleasis TaxID=2725268 RepID=A0A7L6N7G3_9MOLU|nr:FMN-binding protein [Hujiaoplasma nucleasis]QLY40915.1 FMN-binding protein [Hujiaoplasma nucleasis]
MKQFFNKNGMVLTLSAILLVIFVFGGMYSRYMSTQLDSHIEEYEQEQAEKEAEEALRKYRQSLIDLVDNGVELQDYTSSQVERLYATPETGVEYQPQLIEAYQVLNDSDQAIAVVYVIETIGRSEGVRVAYSISLETDQVTDIVVVSHNETTQVENDYYNLLDENFFNQFNNLDFNVVELGFDSVSGATSSSEAFETGLNYARVLYANDFDFEIPQPTIEFVFNSMVFNYDLSTITSFELVADVSFDGGNKQALIGFDTAYNFVQVLQGDTLTEDEQLAFASQAEAASTITEMVEVLAYDDDNQVITIKVFGFNKNGITLDVQLNASGTSVTSISMVSTSENYDSEYYGGYDGDPAPAVEDAYINEFNTNGTVLDAVAGATRTSEAMTAAVEWAKNFGASSGVVDVSVDAFDFNYDLTTLVDYPFVADITFDSDKQATILVGADYNYGGLVSGIEPGQDVINALTDPLEAANSIDDMVDIISYDSTNHTIEILVFGFNRDGITLLAQLNNDESLVESVSIVTTKENYDSEYYGGYDGDPAPAVENGFINQYNTDGTIIDGVAGATRTSNAMTAALEWLNTFMNGGN